MPIGRFLAGIGALIWSQQDKKYLLLQRSETRDYGGGSWECVTGRVDQGESFEDALHREIMEEIGIEVQLDFLLGTTHFYRGNPPSSENELVGVLYACSLKGAKPDNFSKEHMQHRWVTYSEAVSMLPEDHWLRPVLKRAEFLRENLPDKLRSIYQEEGFEESGNRIVEGRRKTDGGRCLA